MNLGERIRKGATWLLFGNIGRRILDFGFGVALARLLIPADFGTILTVQVFTGFVSMLTSGGMGQSLVRTKEINERDFDAVFTLQLALGILAYLGFYLVAPSIAGAFDEPLYVDLIRVSALVYLLRPFSLIRNSWLTREMDFKSRAVIQFLTAAITGASSVTMAWFGMGVWSLTFSGLIGAFVSNILLAVVTPIRLHLDPSLAIVRKHSTYGFKLVVNDFLKYFMIQSKNLIISKVAGPGFLGLYNKGESLSRMPGDIITPAVMQPVFRAMSIVQDDLDQTKYLFYRVITLLMLYTAPLYIVLWWVAEPFILVVYGENWVPAAEPLRILALLGLVRTIHMPSSRLLEAQNLLGREMLVQCGTLILVTLGCLIGLSWGLSGVAWGMVVAQVVATSALYFMVFKSISTRVRDLARAVTPGLLFGIYLFVVLGASHFGLGAIRFQTPALYVLIMAVAGATSYAAAFFLMPIPALRSEAKRWRRALPFQRDVGDT